MLIYYGDYAQSVFVIISMVICYFLSGFSVLVTGKFWLSVTCMLVHPILSPEFGVLVFTKL